MATQEHQQSPAIRGKLHTIDRFLFWLLIVPIMAYCLWTKWAVTSTAIPLDAFGLMDFFRLNGAYYVLMTLWCALMLKPDRGLWLLRGLVILTVLYFAATDMSYSAAIYYTGALAPYDVSYYAASSVGKLPFSIPTTEFLTLLVLPLVFLSSVLWKLRRLSLNATTEWKRYSLAFVLLLTCTAVRPLSPDVEANLVRPSYIYQIAEFTERKSIWPQAVAASEAIISAQPLPLLQLTPTREQHPNVVIIALESVSAQATGVYNPARRDVTPYLNALAANSLLAEQAFTVVPHTSKALVAINCGIEPSFMHPIFESTFGTYQRCLPELLRQQGYDTAFFQSPTEHFENRRGTVQNLGFQTFMANEQLDPTGFQLVNYFGYEDDILLQPSQQWLSQRKGPFMAFYLTGTTHHPYWTPDSLPAQTFEPEDKHHNQYLNAVHYLDRFISKLIRQYQDAGLYDNTIFVIVGDHGESLGQHSRMQHNVSMYQEVMQVPLIIHAPSMLTAATTPLASQVDIVPTLLALSGFEPTRSLPGYNLLDQHRSTAIANCWYDDWCMASTDGKLKFIHNYDEKRDEVFDLRIDPLEQHNVIARYADWADEQRQALHAQQERNQAQWHQFLSAQNEDYWDQRDATVGTPIGLIALPEDDPRKARLTQ